MTKPTILITGCSGFIGRHLCKHLHNEYNIIGYDREDPHPKFSRYIDRFVKRDITEELLNHNDIDIVIHLAARAGVRKSREEFDSYVKDNIIGTQRVLEKCIDSWKPKKILLASSSSVYGDRTTPSKETHIYKPKSPYAMTKVAMEQISKTYRDCKLLDCQICNMRFYTVYGPYQRDGLAIHNFIEGALRDKDIIVYGDGKQSRDFSYIDDLCEAILRLTRKQTLPFILNVGFGTNTSLNKVLDIISSHLNKKLNIKYRPRNRYDVMKTKADTRLLHRTLPTQIPIISIKEGIIKQIEQVKEDIL